MENTTCVQNVNGWEQICFELITFYVSSASDESLFVCLGLVVLLNVALYAK
jgi:hypothetical protein